ncbi:hypothetical protein QEZ54_17165 [Catellatospora sp. KI3]|uniref:hypothetical protein n=1 Tax=Catellatospora sp. KI3 TaxID=3041620 RepID=UPI002482FAB8|nr:hypothetical protein [Catellatospora sp. KI3]MDI1462707.1 hypothetical protein [Catellatospora sp. KI3]
MIRTTRVPVGLAAVWALLLTPAAPASAVPVRGPLPCLAPATADLLDEGAVLKTSLATYRATTAGSYWSVVATRGSQGYDSDIALHDPTACLLNSSAQGGFSPADWVAFDNNSGRLPTGMNPTRVYGHPGNTSPVKYKVQFVSGDQTLSTTATVFQPVGTAYGDWIVDIRDVYLTAGTPYTFTVTGGLSHLYVLGSSAGAPATWSRTAAGADFALHLPGTDLYTAQAGSLAVTPAQSGWYAALFVRDGWWGAPVSVRITSP